MDQTSPKAEGEATRYAATDEIRPTDAESTCLRPLGLCELGGCCDICWYRPGHPRFSEKRTPGDDVHSR